MHRSEGLTLVEVLVALVILAVGIVAAATMQTTALRTTNRGNISQDLVKLAEAELELQRQLATPTAGTACLSASRTGYSCRITVVPCQYQAPPSNNIACASTTPAASRIAFQTTVVVTGPRTISFTLSDLILSETT